MRVSRENRSANQVNEMLIRWQNAAAKAVLKFKQIADIPSSGDFFAVVDNEFYSENGFVSPVARELVQVCRRPAVKSWRVNSTNSSPWT